LPALPRAVMRSPVITTVMSGLGGAPVASITVTWIMASRRGRVCAPGCADIKNERSTKHNIAGNLPITNGPGRRFCGLDGYGNEARNSDSVR
jgi:hypothetical protein